MKRKLQLHQVPMSRALKKELNRVIAAGELFVYLHKWYLQPDSIPVGKIKSIRWNDKARTNVIEVELDAPDLWRPEYNLVRSMVTNKLHVHLG